MTAFRFHSDAFDHASELPDHYNAGNRFHGEDLAAFIAAQLREAGRSGEHYDEDWGWRVSGRFDALSILEVAVYNLSDHREGGHAGVPDWGLWVRADEQRKMPSLFTRSTEVEVTEARQALLRALFARRGIELHPWADGPHA